MTEESVSKTPSEFFNERGCLKRACRLQKKEIEENEFSDLEIEDGEITDDVDSDLDYNPNAPKLKKKKKKVKLKDEETEKPKREPRKQKKQDFKPPSFDQVMKTQISHLARFIEYEEYDSYGETSSEYEERTLPEQQPRLNQGQRSIPEQPQRIHRSPTPEPIPLKEKKKRVVIYPWRPIGITSGCSGVEEVYLTTREPVNDVRKLLEIENYF